MKPLMSSAQNILNRSENLFSGLRPVLLIFALLGLAVFWPALHGAFVGDDVLRVIEYEPLVSGSLWDLLSYYKTDRPVVMLTVWLNYQIGGLNPFIYKITNLISHILCAFSGFVLLKRLLKNVPLKNTVSFFAAAIFLVHPLNHHVVQAAVQRSVSMAGIFLILSFIYFINFYETGKRDAYLVSLLMFLLAVLSKPVSIALPLALAIYLLLEKAKASDIFKWISFYFLFWLIPVWNYSGDLPVGSSSSVFKFEHWRYFLIQTKVFFIYLYKFFFPFPMEFIHPIHNSVEKIYEENFVPYLGAYLLIFVSLALWFLKKRSVVAALLLIGYVLYLPQSSFYSILHVLFYHRVYLTVLFGSCAVSYLLFNCKFLKERAALAVSILSIAVVYFAVSSFIYFSQVKTYSDWLWYNIQANPGNLNYNVSTLFMLKRRGYPQELIAKFAGFLVEHHPEKEVLLAKSVALYTYDNADAKKVVLEIAGYLSSVQTSNSFFHGAMLFLESEAFRFFPHEQAVLSLNSIYFSRLNTSVFLSDTVLKGFAKRNFESVLKIQNPPASVGSEKLEFFKLRSRIILLLYFKEDTGLNLAEASALLQSNYGDMPESKWLIEKIQTVK